MTLPLPPSHFSTYLRRQDWATPYPGLLEHPWEELAARLAGQAAAYWAKHTSEWVGLAWDDTGEQTSVLLTTRSGTINIADFSDLISRTFKTAPRALREKSEELYEQVARLATNFTADVLLRVAGDGSGPSGIALSYLHDESPLRIAATCPALFTEDGELRLPLSPVKQFECALQGPDFAALASLASKVCAGGDELVVMAAASDLVLRTAKDELELGAEERMQLLELVSTLRNHVGGLFRDPIEDIIANVFCMLEGDSKAVDFALEHLVDRATTTSSRLASNVAGVAADLEREETMWAWLEIALERGADKKAIAEDEDFEDHRDRPRFQKLLDSATRSPEALGDALIEAADDLDVETMRALLAEGADPCFVSDHTSVIETVAGAFVSRRKKHLKLEAMRLLLEAGAPAPLVDQMVRQGREMVEMLRSFGAETTYDAVLRAAETEDMDTLECVAIGISLSPIADDVESPFERCRHHKTPAIAERLLTMGARLDEGNAPKFLHSLSSADNSPLIRWLVEEQSVCINARDSGGDSALFHAAFNDNEAAAQTLLALGCDVQARNNSGQTILHACAASGAPCVMAVALEAAASVAIADNAGDTPLHLAAEIGRAAACRTLLSHGADPDAVNIAGKTPFGLCESSEVRRILTAGPKRAT